MKVFLGVLLLATATISAEIKFKSQEVPSVYGYHANFGIKEAERIRKAEEEYLNDPTRIAGGDPAILGQFPYNAGLVITITTGETSVCGATILSQTKLVTAAHCWWDGRNQAQSFTVVLGSQFLFFGGTRVSTTNVEMHEYWNFNNANNDIAIITISPVALNYAISPIELPSGTDLYQDFAGYKGIATGFGMRGDGSSNNIDGSQYLSFINLDIITNYWCTYSFGAEVITPSTLCTSGNGGVGTCSGDSGGPLAVDYNGRRILIGVISFGAQSGCTVGAPSGHARVSHFVDWIKNRL